uniref:[histone H3]-trimethyl-L-lysine(4) demethylase n=1 Tax=Cacopsylla melanoneura TaxID=428564 RepID=A0A8D8Y443_9HEMI
MSNNKVVPDCIDISTGNDSADDSDVVIEQESMRVKMETKHEKKEPSFVESTIRNERKPFVPNKYFTDPGTFMSDGKFHFQQPREAPVFTPTAEQFKDPLKYINEIREIGAQYGICKIKPPPNWQPPFTLDVDNFKFVPRIQKLNELEALTRVKLNFLDQIAKFWELQGSQFKIPVVEKRAVDLYSLYKIILDEGGIDVVNKYKKWKTVCSRMGYQPSKHTQNVLKGHYDRILHPFYLLEEAKECGQEDKYLDEFKGTLSKNKQLFDAGQNASDIAVSKRRPYSRGKKCKKKSEDDDPLAKYVCHNCGRGDSEASMLLCDGCDDSFHTFCLTPPLAEIPKGDWRCPKCVAFEVAQPTEAFGFEQARREYSLQQFGEMADQFKSDYFNMPVHLVPTSAVEKEYWRVVSLIDGDITVEYGADLHTMDHGSGFPTKSCVNKAEQDEESTDLKMYTTYVESGWNLNNLPVLEGSVLGHITANISGMKVPWMYVGMCFSTFCWHNEDHWSYSINYLHWGEAKTWYGVPGSSAEHFEEVMYSAVPELFQSQPDLLHQLVTIMNPNIFMNHNVPICRTDQQAGEFVITFPRAYHAGFNQGYNFAEAVNFAPPDWLKIGRECINNYSKLHRFCVFSHDELICKMAIELDDLDPKTAAETHYDMLRMVQFEITLRKKLRSWGVREAKRESFELLPDDERLCSICKTTCFISSLTCKCNNMQKQVCLRHYSELCSCPPVQHVLKYRYTLDELHIMLQKLKVKAESLDAWFLGVKRALDVTLAKSVDLNGMKALVNEAREKKFPESKLLRSLEDAIDEAEKCSNIAKQLQQRKMKTRLQKSWDLNVKLTVGELIMLNELIDNLHCTIEEGEFVKTLLDSVRTFEEEAKQTLVDTDVDIDELSNLIDEGLALAINSELLPKLKVKLDQMKWMKRACVPTLLSVVQITELITDSKDVETTQEITAKVEELKDLQLKIEEWESAALECMSSETKLDINVFENLMNTAADIKALLPSKLVLKDLIKKYKNIQKKVEKSLGCDNCYLSEFTDSLSEASSIVVKVNSLEEIEKRFCEANNWIQKTTKVFMFKNTPFTLLEVLSPKTDCKKVSKKFMRTGKPHLQDNGVPLIDKVALCPGTDPCEVVSAFGTARRNELTLYTEMRLENLGKRKKMSDIKYCLCKQAAHLDENEMIECVLCKEWYHKTCIRAQLVNSTSDLYYVKNYLCPCCLRSKRPNLQTILALVVNLEKINVRIPEGEILQALIERVMTWIDRVKKFMLNKDIERLRALLRTNSSANKIPILPENYTIVEDLFYEGLLIEVHLTQDMDDICNMITHTYPDGKINKQTNPLISTTDRQIWKQRLEKFVSNPFQNAKRRLQTKKQGGRVMKRLKKTDTDNVQIGMEEETEDPLSSEDQVANTSVNENSINSIDMEEDGEDELCSYVPCLRPEGDQVDWVQCDGGCEQWFHMICVNLNKTDLREDQEYICETCDHGKSSSNTSGASRHVDLSCVKLEVDMAS